MAASWNNLLFYDNVDQYESIGSFLPKERVQKLYERAIKQKQREDVRYGRPALITKAGDRIYGALLLTHHKTDAPKVHNTVPVSSPPNNKRNLSNNARASKIMSTIEHDTVSGRLYDINAHHLVSQPLATDHPHISVQRYATPDEVSGKNALGVRAMLADKFLAKLPDMGCAQEQIEKLFFKKFREILIAFIKIGLLHNNLSLENILVFNFRKKKSNNVNKNNTYDFDLRVIDIHPFVLRNKPLINFSTVPEKTNELKRAYTQAKVKNLNFHVIFGDNKSKNGFADFFRNKRSSMYFLLNKPNLTHSNMNRVDKLANMKKKVQPFLTNERLNMSFNANELYPTINNRFASHKNKA
tara:strand:- start:81 stop:1145 length:1065 start_codon:yes stop_codon:yes gene_type:complete